MTNNLQKSFLILGVILLMVCVVLGLRTVSIGSPTNNTNVSGTIVLNATVDGTAGITDTNVTNVTFMWQNLTTGYYVVNSTVVNSTINQTFFQNLSFNTRFVPDGRYNLTIAVQNSSNTFL